MGSYLFLIPWLTNTTKMQGVLPLNGSKKVG